MLLLHLIFLTPVQSSEHRRDIKTSDFQIFLRSSSSFSMYSQHKAGRERTLFRNVKEMLLILGRKSPFHLSCSVLSLWCLTASCQLVAGNMNHSSITSVKEMEHGCWGRSSLLTPLTPTAFPGIGKIFRVRQCS